MIHKQSSDNLFVPHSQSDSFAPAGLLKEWKQRPRAATTYWCWETTSATGGPPDAASPGCAIRHSVSAETNLLPIGNSSGNTD